MIKKDSISYPKHMDTPASKSINDVLHAETRSDAFKKVKRIVVKVGTSSLTYPNGSIHFSQMEKLVRQLAELSHQGYEVVLVTSGAIGAGVGLLNLPQAPTLLPEKQAVAAIGQLHLMHLYQKFFSEYGKRIGQILLSKDDILNKKRSQNARNTFDSLLNYGAIPIVNENDAVVVDEIKVGDNDTLSAYVAQLIQADLLILISDIDGLYTDNPRTNPSAVKLDEVSEITDSIINLAKGSGSSLGTGGMATKLKAAKIAHDCGTHMIIANSFEPQVLTRIMSGETLGTWFKGGRDEWVVKITKRGDSNRD
jgi:glutamate 5-kinase